LPEDPFGLVYLKGRTSIFHKMSPLDKIILLGCVVVLAVLSIQLVAHLLILLAVIIVSLIACKPTFREFLRPWKILLPIFIPMVLLPPLSFAAQAQWYWGTQDIRYLNLVFFSIPYSEIGLRYGYVIFLRGIAVCLSALILTWTTQPRDLIYTMVKQLKVNYRLAWSAFLALIYSPLITYEATMISYAQKIRGVKYSKFNFIAAFKKFLFPLILRGAKKAVVTSLALDGRAFGTYPSRTFRYPPQKWKYSTVIAIIVIAITIIYVIHYPPNPVAIWTPWTFEFK